MNQENHISAQTPGPPPPWTPPPVYVIRGDRNGAGTAGLVLGCIALALAVIPLVGIVAWLIWPPALALSAVGLSRCDRQLATNRAIAVAGLIVAAMAAVVCVAWLALTIVGMSTT